MQQLISITSQGQITIPASMRRALGLEKYRKASVRTKDNKIIVEPVPDLLSLAGILKNKAIKGKTAAKVITLETEAVAKSVAQKYASKKDEKIHR